MGHGSGVMEKETKGFRQLTIWQKAYELTLWIYKVTKKFPRTEAYGLSSQLQRAAASIPANIAEGYECNQRKEYSQFLFISKGSLGEVETYILLAKDLGYLTEDEYLFIDEKRKASAMLLKGLIKSLA
jgi:four helix bundle protein